MLNVYRKMVNFNWIHCNQNYCSFCSKYFTHCGNACLLFLIPFTRPNKTQTSSHLLNIAGEMITVFCSDIEARTQFKNEVKDYFQHNLVSLNHVHHL